MGNFETDWDDIVTHYKLPTTRPLAENEQLDVSEKHIPDWVRFSLAESGDVVAVLPANREIVIGRFGRTGDPSVTLDLQDLGAQEHGISRYHAMVAVVQDRLALQDLNSANGTLLNRRKVTPMKRYALVSGDEITLGTLTLRIEFVWA